MAYIDRTRVRSRIKANMPRLQELGRVYAYDQGSWRLPPLYNESVHKFETQDIWYEKAETTADEVHKGPPWHSGGPFLNIKLGSAYRDDSVQGYGQYGADKTAIQFFTGLGPRPVMYQGGFMPLWPSDNLLPTSYSNMWNTDFLLKTVNNSLVPSLSAWGPEAWAKTAPRIEMASGFVALAESRDVPHMLKQTSKDFHYIWKSMGGQPVIPIQAPKKVSETFLNHQFGWVPFLSDMRKFYNAYKNTGNYMARMSQGNDKWKVYRRTLLNTNSSVKIMSGTNWVVYPGSQAIQSQMTRIPNTNYWEIWEEKSTLITSSGRFKWYKPEFELDGPEHFKYNSGWDNINRQLTMYGARISPSNVWRATPWTWLIDWGFNVGRSIDRIQEQLLDGVVSQYLYLMHHDIKKLVFKVTIPFKSGDVHLTWHRLIEVKQRREAGSPYGFDLSWDTFSPMRLAILAALGITRTTPR